MKRYRRRLGGCARLILIVTVLSIMLGTTDVLQAACYDMSNFPERQECMKALIDRLPQPKGVEIKRILEDLERRKVSTEIRSRLKKKALEFDEMWGKISQELEEQDKALRSEYERAKSDAVIRGWASGLQLLAASLDLLATLSETKTKPESNQTASKVSPGEQITNEESYIFYRDSNGNWRSIHMQRQIDELGKTRLFKKEVTKGLSTTAETFKGTSMLHDPETGRMFLGPTKVVEGYVRRKITRPKSPSKQDRPQGTTRLRKIAKGVADFARSLKQSPYADEISSVVDMVPGASTIKGLSEVATGKDLVTGKPVKRATAAAGFTMSVIPAGKLFVKVGVTSVKYTKVVLRHYTRRSNSELILKEGILRPNTKGKIFAEKANRKTLSKTDAESRYGLERGKGRDVVEFSPMEDQRWEVKYNPVMKVEEVIVYGKVPLGPGSKVLQR